MKFLVKKMLPILAVISFFCCQTAQTGIGDLVKKVVDLSVKLREWQEKNGAYTDQTTEKAQLDDAHGVIENIKTIVIGEEEEGEKNLLILAEEAGKMYMDQAHFFTILKEVKALLGDNKGKSSALAVATAVFATLYVDWKYGFICRSVFEMIWKQVCNIEGEDLKDMLWEVFDTLVFIPLKACSGYWTMEVLEENPVRSVASILGLAVVTFEGIQTYRGGSSMFFGADDEGNRHFRTSSNPLGGLFKKSESKATPPGGGGTPPESLVDPDSDRE